MFHDGFIEMGLMVSRLSSDARLEYSNNLIWFLSQVMLNIVVAVLLDEV